MNKTIIGIILTLHISPVFGQFSEEKIISDSTEVRLVRNSVYRVWEETYKYKDSVFYSVRYLDDTTKTKIEGWKRKNGDYFGNWVEYSPEGTWLHTINYDRDIWKVNKKEYPFYSLLDSMKRCADNIIIKKYGLAFFKNNIRFKFHGFTEIAYRETTNEGTFWTRDKYLGSWIEPIKIKPNSYTLDYTIRLGNKHFYYNKLRIRVDSLGNIIDKPDDFDGMFAERKAAKLDKFSLTYEKALDICKKNGLKIEKGNSIDAELRYDFRKRDLYAGEYYFEVAQQYDVKIEGDCKKKCLEIKYYNVWRLNPWTSELFFSKKMKRVTSWTPGCGVSGGYEDIDK